MGVFKVAMSGHRGAGKTSLLKAMSDMPIVSVEKRMVPGGQHLSLEYGRVFVGSTMIYLYSFDYENGSHEWLAYLRREMSFLLTVVDGTAQPAVDWADELAAVRSSWDGPCGIVVSKLDSENYRSEAYDRARRLYFDHTWLLHRDRSYVRAFAGEFADVLEGGFGP